MAPERDDDVSNVMLIFIRASAVFVGLAVIVLIALFVISRLSGESDTSNPAPYSIASRPLPNVGQLGDLLPDQLGSFKRTSLAGGLADFSAVYTNGNSKITIAGSQAVSNRAAQAGVSQVLRTAGRASNSQLTDTDPSYYLSLQDNGPSRFAWSHGRWFFDIQATSRSALDDFMRVFKY
jgi:hypothetical protein